MTFGIAHLDFDQRKITLVAPESTNDKKHEQLVNVCEARGFEIAFTNESGVGGTTESRVLFSFDLRNGLFRYGFLFSDKDNALNDVTDAVLIVSAALGFDERATSQLRLAAYELCINSVEHGNYAKRSLRISLAITSKDGRASIIYKDNGEMFTTTNHVHMSVADKIKDRDKRGLGLFILNKMIGSIGYKRMGTWNVTSFNIESEQHESHRRQGMSTFDVQVTPHGDDGTTVIRPKGSIDSSTVQALEPHIRSVIDSGTKRVVIDFSEVEFVSSAGVGIFLGSVSELREKGGDLLFACVPKHIDEVFEIINVKSFFTILGSLDELDSVTQL